jgi:hypothetical protein
MPVEQFIPGVRVACAATADQAGFRVGGHLGECYRPRAVPAIPVKRGWRFTEGEPAMGRAGGGSGMVCNNPAIPGRMGA